MSCIWKYPLLGFGRHEIKLPKRAEIRMINTDPATDRPALWCEVDAKEWQTSTRTFHVIATGEEVPEDTKFRGSGRSRIGLVFHVFEEEVV